MEAQVRPLLGDVDAETQTSEAPEAVSLDLLKGHADRLRIFKRDTGIIASDPIWHTTQNEMEAVLQMKKLTNLLIHGETGVGKELIARALHEFHPRHSQGPFIPINCGALPEQIFESELFGHKRGAFSGAVMDKKGLFEIARGGVLFLDEISDLPMLLQTKLLRVLQERKIRPVGGVQEIDVSDVFVICATHRDLQNSVARGTFREDLFYRIDVVKIKVPPLRERREDIPGLVAFFADQYREDETPHYISSTALKSLRDYAWPGNVRELENVIAKAVVFRRDQGDTIGVQDLRNLSSDHADSEEPCGADMPVSSFRAYIRKRTMKARKEYVIDILRRTRGSVSQAAELSEMDRANFRRVCRTVNVDPEDFR